MLYSILIYGSEGEVAAWTPEEENEVLGRHAELRQELASDRRKDRSQVQGEALHH
ncbi:MAG: hypothetical protein ACRETT_13690 [Steroidobacteraceae bacterium]